MASDVTKTKTPGIFKRGSRYVVFYRDAEGKQHKEAARTLEDARLLKSKRTTQVNEGEFHKDTKVRLHLYAREWVQRYQGKGRRGFRENTRVDYARALEQYVLVYFNDRTVLASLQPTHVSKFVGWLCDAEAQGKRLAEQRRMVLAAKLGVPEHTLSLTEPDEDGKPTPVEPVALSDSTIRNIMAPLSACLATARAEGLIRSNPAREIDLPHRPTVEDDEDDEKRAMSREQLALVLDLIPPKHRLFFQLLAATGLRISEAVALQWKHLHLDGDRPHVKVRRALVRGQMGQPKSKHGKREVPITLALADALRDHKAKVGGDPEALAFQASNGAALNQGNLRRRVLAPAASEACLWPGFGFHAFRHTCASLLFAEGRNVKQVQRWLGHSSPTFTLTTYVHLLPDEIAAPLHIEATPASLNQGRTALPIAA